MTVAHKDLTGTDLHEVKGASTATVGQVPVSDGAGGAPFAKLTHTSLQTTGNPFGAQLLHVREEQNSGTSSSSTMSASYNKMTLNTTKTNEITSASLASSQINLPAGTYFVSGWASWAINSAATAQCHVRVRDVTNSVTLVSGGHNYVVGVNASGQNYFNGRFTLAGTALIELQQYVQDGSGIIPFTGGEKEVYNDVMIWKVS